MDETEREKIEKLGKALNALNVALGELKRKLWILNTAAAEMEEAVRELQKQITGKEKGEE